MRSRIGSRAAPLVSDKERAEARLNDLLSESRLALARDARRSMPGVRALLLALADQSPFLVGIGPTRDRCALGMLCEARRTIFSRDLVREADAALRRTMDIAP